MRDYETFLVSGKEYGKNIDKMQNLFVGFQEATSKLSNVISQMTGAIDAVAISANTAAVDMSDKTSISTSFIALYQFNLIGHLYLHRVLRK